MNESLPNPIDQEPLITHHAEFALNALRDYLEVNKHNPKLSKTLPKLQSPEYSGTLVENTKTLFEIISAEGIQTETLVENAKTLFEIITTEGIQNSAVFESKEFGAAFPWTVVNLTTVAQLIVAQSKKPKEIGQFILPPAIQSQGQSSKEFIVGSFLNPQNGNQFCFFEEVLHQVTLHLPTALQALKDGKPTESKEFYILGSPTNEYGSISKDFVQSLNGNHAFEQFGKLYAEFVKTVLSDGLAAEQSTSDLHFSGLSMGGSLAAQTAAELLKTGEATQSEAEYGSKPRVTVRLDVPAGASDLPAHRKSWQIPAGFALDGLYNLMTNPYSRAAVFQEKPFLDSVDSRMSSQGIKKNMSADQTTLKKSAIGQIIRNLRSGVPLPDTVKTTEVIGLFDPTTFSFERLKTATEQRQGRPPSLGSGLISDRTTEHRKFAIKMGHSIPFYRDSELRRIAKAAKAITELSTTTA